MVASKGVVGGTAESSHLDPQAGGSGAGTGLLRAQDPRLVHTSSNTAALPNPPQILPSADQVFKHMSVWGTFSYNHRIPAPATHRLGAAS